MMMLFYIFNILLFFQLIIFSWIKVIREAQLGTYLFILISNLMLSINLYYIFEKF